MSKYLCTSVGNILYLLANHVHDISQIDQIQAKPKPTVHDISQIDQIQAKPKPTVLLNP